MDVDQVIKKTKEYYKNLRLSVPKRTFYLFFNS